MTLLNIPGDILRYDNHQNKWCCNLIALFLVAQHICLFSFFVGISLPMSQQSSQLMDHLNLVSAWCQ